MSGHPLPLSTANVNGTTVCTTSPALAHLRMTNHASVGYQQLIGQKKQKGSSSCFINRLEREKESIRSEFVLERVLKVLKNRDSAEDCIRALEAGFVCLTTNALSHGVDINAILVLSGRSDVGVEIFTSNTLTLFRTLSLGFGKLCFNRTTNITRVVLKLNLLK